MVDTVKIIPIRTAFRQLAISNSTGYRLVKSGKLGPTFLIGRRRFIQQSDVWAYVERAIASIDLELHSSQSGAYESNQRR